MNPLATFIITFVLCTLSIPLLSAEIYTYRGKESDTDTRGDYGTALFKLALDKTVESHGEYELVFLDKMNTGRSLKVLQNNQYSNFFAKQSVSKDRLKQFGYVDFPVDLGIVGYRVFFVSPDAVARLNQVETLEQLKKFTIGQGIGWLDEDILKHNGFQVVTGSNYESLFNMVSRNRFDLFSRGVNELLKEYRANLDINNLLYDNRIALYYPLPRFFFTHKSNKAAIERIQTGLIRAYQDGSLVELWLEYYGESLDFINLNNRKIFKIENPFIKGINSGYEKYIFDASPSNNTTKNNSINN
tara:strand:+ start:146 stop:1048 length:903 start_codon:yes stop_codon:yes gene_type:complete